MAGRSSAGGRDGRLTAWDAETGLRLHVVDLGKPITALAVSGGSRPGIAVGLADGQIRWFPQGLEQPAVPLQGHTDAVTGLALVPDDRQLVSCGQDGQVIRWDGTSGKAVSTYRHASPCRALASTSNASLILLGGDDGKLAICDGQSGKALLSVQAHGTALTSVAVSPDGM